MNIILLLIYCYYYDNLKYVHVLENDDYFDSK